MSTRGWIIFVVVCVVGFGALILLSQKDRIDVSGVNEKKVLASSEASGGIADHTLGKVDSKVILVEYGDFQCSGCGAAYPRVKSLLEKYDDKIVFVYRNFPLTQIHANARAAAAVAEAAGLEGKYWEMHDMLFENQTDWSNASTSDRGGIFEDYAREIGIDVASFKATLESKNSQISKKINFDLALGRKLNINSTPTFYLNGTKLGDETAGSDETFEKAILAELKKQGISVETE